MRANRPCGHRGAGRRAAATIGLLLALGLVTPGAHAAPTPKPTPSPSPSTPTLPVPRSTVDPGQSVGGPLLASMGLVIDKPATVPAPPALRDVSWVLADLDSGAVLAAKAAHARMLPASTLKTLTALTLLPQVDPTTTHIATRADANADGTRVGLLPTYPYTGRDLFNGLLMASGNDAAYALAEVAGGKETTLTQMNAVAARLGAHDTVAKDPSGLDAPGQTSSAYDLALIGRAAMQRADFRRYVTTRQVAFPGRSDAKGKRASYLIQNHNRLLYNYPGTIGVKNGYTEAAKRTYISAVTRGGRTYLLTEMYSLESSWRPQAAVYDWAFRYGPTLRPVGQLVEPGTVPAPPAAAPSPAPSFGAASPDANAFPPATRGPAGPTDPASPAANRPGSQAAAALPSDDLGEGATPWVGLGGLVAALLLVGALALRAFGRPGSRAGR